MTKRKVFHIVGGVSGCGKSTLAEETAKTSLAAGNTVVHLETDKLMYDSDGTYRFCEKKVLWAHGETLNLAKKAFENNVDVVILSNQSIREKDMTPYIKLAEDAGYMVFRYVVENLAGRTNDHGVTLIQRIESARIIRANIKLI